MAGNIFIMTEPISLNNSLLITFMFLAVIGITIGLAYDYYQKRKRKKEGNHV